MEAKYIIIQRHKGHWGTITNYGWKTLADAYYGIARQAMDIAEAWKIGREICADRAYQIVRIGSTVTVREFTHDEAVALYFVLYKKAFGQYPYKLNKPDTSYLKVSVSPQKLMAIGKEVFAEVSWKKQKCWGHKID